MTEYICEMLLFLCGICLVSIVSALGDDCYQYGTLVYEDLACTPEYVKDKKCPVKYNCTGLDSNDKNCYFKGKIYQNGERVESSLSQPSCDEDCRCRTDGSSPGFTCAILDCPEWLGFPLSFGCYRKYELGLCCSVGEICPPFDKIEKCLVGGKEYLEGQQFSPENTCLSCVCQKGFQGKFEEPFCRKVSCAQQLKRFGQIQKSCAPFYSKQLNEKVLCCPDNWICPDSTEVTIKGEVKSDEKCKFGDKNLNVGQYFEKTNITDSFGRNFEKIRCECVIPPFTKCHDV